MREMPAFGAERTMLYKPKGTRKKGFRLVREIFSDDGWTLIYDTDLQDWVEWPGEWKQIEQLGVFDTVDDAKAHMLAATSQEQST